MIETKTLYPLSYVPCNVPMIRRSEGLEDISEDKLQKTLSLIFTPKMVTTDIQTKVFFRILRCQCHFLAFSRRFWVILLESHRGAII